MGNTKALPTLSTCGGTSEPPSPQPPSFLSNTRNCARARPARMHSTFIAATRDSHTYLSRDDRRVAMSIALSTMPPPQSRTVAAVLPINLEVGPDCCKPICESTKAVGGISSPGRNCSHLLYFPSDCAVSSRVHCMFVGRLYIFSCALRPTSGKSGFSGGENSTSDAANVLPDL